MIVDLRVNLVQYSRPKQASHSSEMRILAKHQELWHLQTFAQPKSRTLQAAIGSWRSSGSLLNPTLRLLKLHLCGAPALRLHCQRAERAHCLMLPCA